MGIMFIVGVRPVMSGIAPVITFPMTFPFIPAAELIFSAVAFMNHIMTSGPSGGLPWVLIQASPNTSHVLASAGLSVVISRSSSLISDLVWIA